MYFSLHPVIYCADLLSNLEGSKKDNSEHLSTEHQKSNLQLQLSPVHCLLLYQRLWLNHKLFMNSVVKHGYLEKVLDIYTWMKKANRMKQ